MNRTLKLLALLIIAFFIIFMHRTFKENDSIREPLTISADFYSQPSASLLESNERMKDLYSIVIALDEFKNINRHYPITPNRGTGWFSSYGDQKNINWIPGLVPIYIEKLPHDPSNGDRLEQYAYQSDGANYKLIAFYPPDCMDMYKSNPALVVTVENRCVGYGFWSKHAKWYGILE